MKMWSLLLVTALVLCIFVACPSVDRNYSCPRVERSYGRASFDEVSDRLYARDLDGLHYLRARLLSDEPAPEPLSARGDLLRSWGPWRRDAYA